MEIRTKNVEPEHLPRCNVLFFSKASSLYFHLEYKLSKRTRVLQ